MPSFSFSVNGRKRTVDVDSDTPLLWILRDTLELRGTKYGCGIGVCGACTVLQGKEAVRSCQRAWLEEDVAQCGYCQPGMLMETCALLAKHPNPTDAQIDEAIDTHVCRCGTYPRIRKAIHRAAKTT